MAHPMAVTRVHPASKRERILDETFILLGEKGYRGLSFKDLAERCALTKQGVLHYFPTKPNLLLALLDERDASIETYLLDELSAEGFESSQDPEDKRNILRQSLTRVVEHMAGTPGLIRLHVVLRAEAIGSNHPASDYFLMRDRATLEWLIHRMNGLTPAPASAARQILAIMLGLQQQWLQESYTFDLLSEWQQSLGKLLTD